MIKLGQAALIVFIIFAIFTIIFLLTSCIFSITNFNGERKGNDEENAPEPFKMQVQNIKLILPIPNLIKGFTALKSLNGRSLRHPVV